MSHYFPSRQYEDVMKLLKWPFSSLPESQPAAKEVMVKFTNLTRYLFLIELPEDLLPSNVTDGVWQGKYISGKREYH